MKKLCLALAVFMALSAPAYARTYSSKDHALGDMYTKALNNMEAAGMLNLMDREKNVTIKDIHFDHGQVFVTVNESYGEATIIYDPIANKLVRP